LLVESDERRERIAAALSRLSARDQLILEMTMADASSAEVAQALRIGVEAARQAKHNALKRAEKALIKEGIHDAR
jgi:DNA-directed RNA polymerase specialized sigma24 family protein